ncbi:hypothetical protein BGW39_004762, partial [Mortierella sp. 14UC]
LRTSTLSQDELKAFNSLMDDDFVECGTAYLMRLAEAIFKEQDGNPIVQYIQRLDKNTWKSAFFGTDAEVKLLRDASPLMRTGNQYRFVHRSVLEYFLSRIIYNPVSIDDDKEADSQDEAEASPPRPLDANSLLFQKNLLEESSVIQFLCDRVKLNLTFEQQLRTVIDQSKIDASTTIAATNAITIL